MVDDVGGGIFYYPEYHIHEHVVSLKTGENKKFGHHKKVNYTPITLKNYLMVENIIIIIYIFNYGCLQYEYDKN